MIDMRTESWLRPAAEPGSEGPHAEGPPGKIDPASVELQLGDPQLKGDPETLELRTAPRRVIRFRRGLLIASAAGIASAIACVAWFALQPVGLSMASEAPDLHAADNPGSPNELAGLPRSYGEGNSTAPDLGPPLPGDLGRPILEHQREMASEDGGPPQASA